MAEFLASLNEDKLSKQALLEDVEADDEMMKEFDDNLPEKLLYQALPLVLHLLLIPSLRSIREKLILVSMKQKVAVKRKTLMFLLI